MTDIRNAEKVIGEVVRNHFKGVEIASVEAEEYVSFYGDDMMDVRVILAEDTMLDTSLTTSIVRHLRPRLEKIGCDHFPVMSFLLKSEIEAQQIETA